MLFSFALMLSYAGFTCMALATNRHHPQLIIGSKLNVRDKRLFTLLGWVALLLSIVPCVIQSGWGVGLTLWCGGLTLSAFLLVAAVTYQPRLGLMGAKFAGVASLSLSIFLLLKR